MKSIALTTIAALALTLGSFGSAQAQEGTIGLQVLPDTPIGSGDTMIVEATDLSPGSIVFLVISQTKENFQLGGVTMELSPPWILQMVGVTGASGEITIQREIESVPLGYEGLEFHVQILALQVNGGPGGVGMGYSTSNLDSFSFEE